MGSAALKVLRRLAKDEGRRSPERKKALRAVELEEAVFEVRLLEPGEWDELDRWAVAETFGEDHLRERLEGTKREEGKR